MRVAIGLVEHEGDLLVMGGPLPAVSAWASRWVELVPSKEKKEAAAKRVARLLDADLDEVVAAMPPAGAG